jgi:hypothetical protein
MHRHRRRGDQIGFFLLRCISLVLVLNCHPAMSVMRGDLVRQRLLFSDWTRAALVHERHRLRATHVAGFNVIELKPGSLEILKGANPFADLLSVEARLGDQSKDSQSHWNCRPTLVTCARRRGDRITTLLPQRIMSAFGTKRTCDQRSAMSAFGGKADTYAKYRRRFFRHANMINAEFPELSGLFRT